ncbi:Kinesin-like protein kif27 [Phlyctochytrium bullatum]|nr:Kinesin-like protein kif27 [Phlyctochytrium bullatum]
MSARILKAICTHYVVAHFDTCIFWMLDLTVSDKRRYITKRELLYKEGYQVPVSEQYLELQRGSLLGLFMNVRKFHPHVVAENAYAVGSLIIWILVSGVVGGIVHSAVELMDHNSAGNEAEEEYKHESKVLRTFLRDSNVKPEVQMMVHAYREMQWNRSKLMDDSEIFSGLPKDLLQRVKNHLYLDLVRNVPILQGLDESFLQVVALKMKSVNVVEGWHVFRKDDRAEELYIIKSGYIDILEIDGTVITTLGPGKCFGEIALIQDDFKSIMLLNDVFARRVADIVAERVAGYTLPRPKLDVPKLETQ